MKLVQSNTLLLLVLLYPLSIFSQTIHVNKKYKLEKLSKSVNTRHDEASPVISPDGKLLYFFVQNHPDNTFGDERFSQDIWFSKLQENGEWSQAKHMGSPFNGNHANQVFTVLNDGRTLFIRGGNRKDEDGFSMVNRSGNGWGKPQELKVEGFEDMNKNRFNGACMSSDGNHMILYFSDNIHRVYNDLWYSKRLDGNNFSRPVKLKGTVNTPLDEFGPFLAPDNKTLYFASSRREGVGGVDLYVTRRLDDTWLNWSAPENLGEPINTNAFDGYISIDAQENIYVAVAGAKIDGGNLDIFKVVPREIEILLDVEVFDANTLDPLMVDVNVSNSSALDSILSTDRSGKAYMTLPSEGTFNFKAGKEGYNSVESAVTIPEVFNDTTVSVRLDLVPIKKDMVIVGNVYDAKTNELIPGASVIVTESTTATEVLNQEVEEGKFVKVVENSGDYGLYATRSGYLENSTQVTVFDGGGQFTADIYLQPIEVGTTVVLKNIYFDFDKTTLKSESFVELDKVVKFLQDNPTLQIEISGHTDSKGSDTYNENLSQGRAESVVQYIIEHGIDEFRLIAKGYGESKPVATNDTDEGRAENRRVEFTVLDM